MSLYRNTPRGSIADQSLIFDEEELDLANDSDGEERLPLNVAFPLIILMSLSCWAIILTVVLWLVGLAN